MALLISAMLVGCSSVAGSYTETAMTTITGQPLPPAKPYMSDDQFYLATTIWAEARGEGTLGMTSVGHIIRNRVLNPRGRYGRGYQGVVTRLWQFSCWNVGDPNRPHLNRTYLDKLTNADGRAWTQAQQIANAIIAGAPDITKGADHYHTHAVDPKWNDDPKKMIPTAVVGNHRFYRQA